MQELITSHTISYTTTIFLMILTPENHAPMKKLDYKVIADMATGSPKNCMKLWDSQSFRLSNTGPIVFSQAAFGNFFEFYWLFSFNSKIEPVSKELIPVIFTILNYFPNFFTGFWLMFFKLQPVISNSTG